MFFGKKKNDKIIEQKIFKGETNFYIAVVGIYYLSRSKDFIIVGTVHGTAKPGAKVYIKNLGEDDDVITETTIKDVYIRDISVPIASDTLVGLKITNGTELNIKVGTVIYTDNATIQDIRSLYVNAINEGYARIKRMELTEEDYAKITLSDLAQLRRIYKIYEDMKKDQLTDEIKENIKNVHNNLAKNMCAKILELKEVYVVMHKKTGEPYMLSRVFQNDEGYVTTPPDIMLITKAYYKMMHDYLKEKYNPETYDIIKIDCGADGKGIYNFLESVFYLNGACGVNVLFEEFSIDASMLVETPDYSNTPQIQVPVTNPDIERWLLLIGQIGNAETEEQKTIQSIFYGHLLRSLAGAKLLVPMKMDGKVDPPDAEGNIVIKQDMTMALATMNGKGEKPAVHMYTDWKRLKMVFKEEDGWNGFVQPISGMINMFDCAINATQFAEAGCYIDQDIYEKEIKKHEQS